MDKKIVYLDINLDDEESGVDAISFVDRPAIEMEWLAFSKDKKDKVNFGKDDVKQMITSPIMLAETEIYRFDPVNGEYYVKFSEETIRNMMIKYFKEDKINNVNEQHDSNRVVEDVYLVESFIVDDRVSLNGFDVPKGSWVGTFYIDNVDYYNKLVNDPEFNGFSLEGNFNSKEEDEVYSKIEEILNDRHLNDLDKYDYIRDILNNEE